MKMTLGKNAETLMCLLTKAGFEAYAVGGFVRDSVMNREAFDVDIATNASVEDMLGLFSGFRCLTQGAKHGTVAVIIENDTIECTTYRIDGSYSDGRHPDFVTFSSTLADDLSRRDFTVNALAYNEFDGIVDLFGGLKDIENKVIRAIGDPDRRFEEDALRIMRALRFSATLGFTAENSTSESMKRNALKLTSVSNERITAEFRKMLVGENIRCVLENFADILSVILGNITLDDEIIKSVESCTAEFDIRLFALIKNQAEPLYFLENGRLTLTKAEKKTVKQLLEISRNPPKNRNDVKKLMSVYGVSPVEKYLKFSDDNFLSAEMSSVLKNDECYSLSQVKISGETLISLGFCGREIQNAKDDILDKIIYGKLKNDETEIIEYLRKKNHE